MPLNPKNQKSHHVDPKKERRSKHFMKVYAPYIPLLLIVGCGIVLSGSTGFRTGPGTVKSYAVNMNDDGLLEATNKMRAREGLNSLTFNNKLDAAAQAKANDMAARNYWNHNTPDGEEPWVFIDKQGYHFTKAAENLAYGFGSSTSTVVGWMNSPAHRANVLDPDLKEVGFGIINSANYQGHGAETIVVAMYGTPAAPPNIASQPQNNVTPSVASATDQKNISLIQSLTNGNAPWSTFAVGLLIGGILTYLIVKHTRGIKRAVVKSEKFVIRHPLFDVTLVALVVLATIVSQRIGSVY